jgi:hypothetical protein
MHPMCVRRRGSLLPKVVGASVNARSHAELDLCLNWLNTATSYWTATNHFFEREETGVHSFPKSGEWKGRQ